MEENVFSNRYHQMVGRSVLAIFLFLLVYLVLLLGALGLAVLCGYLGLALVVLKFHLLTLALGGGLICMGLLTLYFVIKFVFSKGGESGFDSMAELSREEQPEIFALIDDIVAQTGTRFPKRVVVSPQVNASVYYDSTFWSMILPVRKNLHIGMGLVNSVSVSEFRAILAHEFGHFSQRSMKVGSYVYNVNRVIYDMLYNNDSYEKAAGNIAGISWHFALFVTIGLKLASGIQWILRQVYGVVNKSYMALSREMEFHADQVAARIAGPGAVIDSLYRLELADRAYSETIDFYNGRISSNEKTRNIFPNHIDAMLILASEAGITIREGLPMVSDTTNSRYGKSKLVIKSQYASHPETVDRAAMVRSYGILPFTSDNRRATVLFQNLESWQQRLTSEMFADVTYEQEPMDLTDSDFSQAYADYRNQVRIHPFFNGYYDNKAFVVFDPHETQSDSNVRPDHFFSDDKVEEVLTLAALEQDIADLHAIPNAKHIRTFDYDGIKYRRKQAPILASELEEGATNLRREIEDNDKAIFMWFRTQCMERNLKAEFERHVDDYDGFRNSAERYYTIHQALQQKMGFLYESTPHDEIRVKLRQLATEEPAFKECIREFSTHRLFGELPQKQRNALMEYVNHNAAYFTGSNYDQAALGLLFGAVGVFPDAVMSTWSTAKKRLLLFLAQVAK